MDFASFQQMVETRSNAEDFEQEDDLMAWKFAQDAADYWQRASEDLKRDTGVGETIR
jgi:hypothetical protein